MGTVYAEITLKNVFDTLACKRRLIKKEEIRETKVQALVDTGAGTLVINDKLRRKLGLGIRGVQEVTLANDTKEIMKTADPVEVHWKNRQMVCQPLVASCSGIILLGAIPLEDMDLIVDPKKQELTGRHGDEILGNLYTLQRPGKAA